MNGPSRRLTLGGSQTPKGTSRSLECRTAFRKRTLTLTETAASSGAPKRAAGPRPARKRKTPSTLLKTILAQLEDAKAEDIATIDLDGKAAIADGMVIASGRSNRHVGAIADQLVEKLKAEGHRDLKVEGLTHSDWVLVDTGDVIVHIFRPEVRSFYNLEKLWSEHAPDERIAS